jgi:hypothetical protein
MELHREMGRLNRVRSGQVTCDGRLVVKLIRFDVNKLDALRDALRYYDTGINNRNQFYLHFLLSIIEKIHHAG